MGANRMREDLMLLLSSCLIILLIFTMADVFGPGPPKTADAYQIMPPEEPGYTYEEVELAAEAGSTGEGSSTEVGFTIGDANVVGVLVVLEWVDDIGDNDQFTVTVIIGGEALATVSGTQGRLELKLNGTPAGEHSVVVEATKCPGIFGRRITKLDLDRGNDWSLTVTGMAKVPDEGAGRA